MSFPAHVNYPLIWHHHSPECHEFPLSLLHLKLLPLASKACHFAPRVRAWPPCLLSLSIKKLGISKKTRASSTFLRRFSQLTSIMQIFFFSPGKIRIDELVHLPHLTRFEIRVASSILFLMDARNCCLPNIRCLEFPSRHIVAAWIVVLQ